MQNYSTLILIALMVVAFYFLIMRPQKKRQQAVQRTMDSLTPGTRVLLTSGLFGTIVSVGTRQTVLETSPGVELTVLKQAIARVVTDADEESFDDDDEIEDEVVDEYAPEGQQPAAPAVTSAPPVVADAEPVRPADQVASSGDHVAPSAGADANPGTTSR